MTYRRHTIVSQDPDLHTYQVTWTIDTEAVSPQAAAKDIWNTYFAEGLGSDEQPSTDSACVFDVSDEHSGGTTRIDLGSPRHAGLFASSPHARRRENLKLLIAYCVVLALLIWGWYAMTAMVHSTTPLEMQPTPATTLTSTAGPTTGTPVVVPTPIPTDTAAVTRSACRAPGSSC